jgi:hypothetical protein
MTRTKVSHKKRFKIKFCFDKWLNPELAPLFVWTFIMFFTLSVPPFFGINNTYIQGLILWLLFIMQVGSWFAQSLQRYLEMIRRA